MVIFSSWRFTMGLNPYRIKQADLGGGVPLNLKISKELHFMTGKILKISLLYPAWGKKGNYFN